MRERHHYGETWTLSQWMMKKLEAAEHWCLRRMLRIPRIDKVSRYEVFRKAGVEKGFLQDIIRRQMTFLGHVIRKDELEKVVLTGYFVTMYQHEGNPDLFNRIYIAHMNYILYLCCLYTYTVLKKSSIA